MLDIILIAIGKIKDKRLADLANDYAKRLKPYARLKVVELEAVSFSENNKEAARKFEGEKIENFLNKQADNRLIYLLAERGERFDSPKLALWLNNKNPLILVLGGSLGFSDELYEKYPSLSLSALTFPHEMARVILLEQIYRATTILKNKNYHY
jgi:23S rRNA (pseudouridine1915-N3)-methyltransferase